MTLPAPFHEADGITLYCGDALDLAPLLQPVDAIITDPPYGETKLEWDRWPDGWPSIVAPLAPQMWCYGSFRMFWERREEFEGWKLAQDIIWEKHNGSGLLADRFRRVHELALHFYQGDWEQLYKVPPMISIGEERIRKPISRQRKPQHWGGLETGEQYAYDGMRLARSVIFARSCHGYAVNETQKPLAIVAPLLDYSVPVGGTVVDLFAGSGTVGVVARAQGKRAILIEKRESQCQQIVKRLAQGELSLL